MLGTTIKDFKLVERLGKGGWGEVWAGEQQLIKTRVAIKLLDSEVSRHQASVERFFNEARAAGKIPHAGIVKIFDVGFYNEQAFLIMELLAGETLAGRIRRVTRMSLEDMLEISRQIAGVLAATHESGIVHRDLKPDNVFLIPDAELPSRERVKILDFGIAKLAGSSTTTTEAGSMGTPAYMAPEQWRDAGSAEAPSDVYSLGCVMFEMCCGRPPFISNSTAEACTQHLEAAPPRAKSIAPGLPSSLDELIDRMLAKHPAARPTLVEISRTLENSRPSADTLLAPSSRNAVVPITVTSLAGAVMAKPEPVEQPRRRRALALGVLGVVVVAGVGTTVYLRTRTSEAVPPALGLQAVEEYGDPRPDTINNRRSDALWSGARDDFARACAEPGAEARWCAGERFATGQLALIRDSIPGAVSAFRAATMIDPGWATAHVALSYALAYAHDLDGALAAARRAQALEPRWWQAAAASARAYVSAGPVEDSLIEYRRALSLSPPNNAVLLSEVALAYHFALQDAEATKLAAQADALDHSLAGVHLIRAERALEADDAKVALSEADLVLAVSPKNGAALIARGDALALTGQRDEATAVYKRAIALRGGLNILAISENRLRKIETALAAGVLPPPRHQLAAPPAAGDSRTPMVPGARSRSDSQPTVNSRAGEERTKMVDGDTGRSKIGEDRNGKTISQTKAPNAQRNVTQAPTAIRKPVADPKPKSNNERSQPTPDTSVE